MDKGQGTRCPRNKGQLTRDKEKGGQGIINKRHGARDNGYVTLYTLSVVVHDSVPSLTATKFNL
jgi:hypothetical protein